ncbi:UDP-N-acetylglucosamine--N-acetylmuramyl-(pentapeptide) pyrophosphoryl-undecaprenol N-acetylglucosamine transferase [Amycolatopsis sp. AA4]|uniref:UDP-N-acetylglucosamine--N-acetylmuramyl- (pentapeptide) pyrophosphoryl-undecaprenol N-acetylglucosamine transferase n=1 Tax=Actinomycetes TaxID=1760 RepID=UPI0001DEE0CD|nr:MULTISPECIES: UDP-N-acetylglucosamine--N-acetylmuramyl-(pentapeptide) pyrophosphoryl-undecaprenol N-acetylglucosamine transferase [Actinomycetes]ATY10014.1 UDP-N-acetylglucosamine--N-acetylmuramyl-(pentapeptide) pyrophosphoryl-undecaprenol N-acetylglucosamine transferase [Amycolatopsis sp. AA4]EFL05442.1 undecaprenyldiphospho-muramoylpentapeptide beta-N-acetylglucosaminyltransferase [Streptomyces sp. AA4]
MDPKPPRVVVAGGHSAGHIEPAMNFADALRRLSPEAEITALGTVRGLDTTLIPARGYPLELIPPVPLPRKATWALLHTPSRLRASIRAAGTILDQVGADVVVGFGGYVAAPAYLAARQRGLPIVVHEANVRPGAANRLAARMTPHVYTASPAVRLKHGTAIGIPLRPAITELDRAATRDAARRRFGLPQDGPVLLVTGGSQGAKTINAATSGAAAALCAAGVRILHITGPQHTVDAADPSHIVLPFVDEMQYAYAAADFAICRSGALTCAELAAVGLPAAFVPLPDRGGEQRLNAEPIVTAGGALLVNDADLTPAWIEAALLPVLTDPAHLAAMSARAATTGAPNADTALARQVLTIAEQHRLPR